MEILDVTLREARYVQNNYLDKEEIFLKNMFSSNIDFIEIGYINDIQKGDFISFLNEKGFGNKSKYSNRLSVMTSPESFNKEYLKILKDYRIGLLRITVTLENISKVQSIVNIVKEKTKCRISLNIIRASKLDESSLVRLCQKINKIRPDYVYIADSNGAMLPRDTLKIIHLLKKELIQIKIGFHPHNNLGMASGNAIAAIEAGCDIIDGSIQGYGKLSGNLATENLISILNKSVDNSSYDLRSVLNASFHLTAKILKSKYYEYKTIGTIVGFKDFNLDAVLRIEDVTKDLKTAKEKYNVWLEGV